MLNDRQHPRSQSQAALLLVQDPSPEAETLVRQGLRSTDSPEAFMALVSALRLHRDVRFTEELITALNGATPALRQAVAETLAELADARTILRLQSLVGDSKVDRGVRQTSLWALARTGRKSAVVVLLDQLSSNEPSLREAAAEGLAELTGQSLGVDIQAWRVWWRAHKEMDNERWLEERLAYQSSRSRRVEGDLERARGQILRLHQQLYARLPAGDRLGRVQELVDDEDPPVRLLAITWSLELLPTADEVGQRALGDLLLRLSYDGAPDVQRAAVLALGRVQDSRVFDRLRILVQRAAATVRAVAARSLAQQVRGPASEIAARQHQVIPVLQKALDDPALEVVIEAAEGLGSLGVPEAGPVLTVLLHHPSQPVRQTAALALERVADATTLDGLLEGLNEPAAAVRFSLVGAVAHAAADSRTVTDAQRTHLTLRLEELLLRDADPGVRSRSATVLGECGSSLVLPTLWGRIMASEDMRVQEKAWGALVEILCRSANLDLLHEWDRRLVDTRQPTRRLQLLTEAYTRWLKREETRSQANSLVEILIAAQIEQGKGAAAYPLVHDLLPRATSDAELDKCLRWLLAIGEQAVKDGNRPEALRILQEAQPFLSRRATFTPDFERLEKLAKP
jgi:HEAT repeat protein